MPVLKELREALAAELADAIDDATVSAAWPTSITPPCIYVIPPLGSVYVTAGPNFGEYIAHLDVAILAAHEPVESALAVVEELLELTLVNSVDWDLDGAEPPAPITVAEGGAEYLGTVVHLSKPVRL